MDLYAFQQFNSTSIMAACEELNSYVLNNLHDFYIYREQNFYELNGLSTSEKNEIVENLKQNQLANYILIDSNSKDYIERNNTRLVCLDGSSAIIVNSTLTETITISGSIVLIEGSTVFNSELISKVVIRDYSTVKGSTLDNAYMVNATLLFSNAYNARMEKQVYINSFSFLGNGVWLKEYAGVGPNCNIISKALEFHRPMEFFAKATDPESIIVIGAHAWIGTNASIVKGCTIGDWSIISAGTVVLKDVESFTLFVPGNSKSILDRTDSILTDETVIRRILTAHWSSYSSHIETIYNTLLNTFKDYPDSNTYLKLFHLYSYSENLRELKKYVVDDSDNYFDFSRDLFEFYSLSKIKFDTKNKKIALRYNNNYPELNQYRFKFVKMLCSFATVTQESAQEFTVHLNDEAIKKLKEIDDCFDAVVNGFISEVQESGVNCFAQFKKIVSPDPM